MPKKKITVLRVFPLFFPFLFAIIMHLFLVFKKFVNFIKLFLVIFEAIPIILLQYQAPLSIILSFKLFAIIIIQILAVLLPKVNATAIL